MIADDDLPDWALTDEERRRFTARDGGRATSGTTGSVQFCACLQPPVREAVPPMSQADRTSTGHAGGQGRRRSAGVLFRAPRRGSR